MDSPVALALMTKAKAIFERPDTFLSFPLCLAYTTDELSLVTDTEISPEQIRSLSEFSRLVNLIPGGTEWPPTEEHYLWDIYQDILDTAKLGYFARTPEEQRDYEKALSLLLTAYGKTLQRLQLTTSTKMPGIWRNRNITPKKSKRRYPLIRRFNAAGSSWSLCSGRGSWMQNSSGLLRDFEPWWKTPGELKRCCATNRRTIPGVAGETNFNPRLTCAQTQMSSASPSAALLPPTCSVLTPGKSSRSQNQS